MGGQKFGETRIYMTFYGEKVPEIFVVTHVRIARPCSQQQSTLAMYLPLLQNETTSK
jgi:hypothetical protein